MKEPNDDFCPEPIYDFWVESYLNRLTLQIQQHLYHRDWSELDGIACRAARCWIDRYGATPESYKVWLATVSLILPSAELGEMEFDLSHNKDPIKPLPIARIPIPNHTDSELVFEDLETFRMWARDNPRKNGETLRRWLEKMGYTI